jgi:DNA-binding NarL/FixJ family response regulator
VGHQRIRVVVAEDHYLVREGVRRALELSGDIELVAAVASADELVQVVGREQPHVVVTDIRMPPTHSTEGIDAALRIRAEHPAVGIVVLSQHNDPDYAMTLFRDGNRGMAYLLKQRVGEPAELARAVREVVTGGSVVDPEVVQALVTRTSRRDESPVARLSQRERDVLALMAEGRTNAAIAATLHLSRSSIEKYSTSIFAKLDLTEEPEQHRRVTAVLAFLDEEGRARPISDIEPTPRQRSSG